MQQKLIINHLSSVICRLPPTSVENPLQINLFMQNKPNFKDIQMNVSIFSQMAYEYNHNWTLGQNKPNSNPNKAKPNNPNVEFTTAWSCGARIVTPEG